jgi:peptidoglycan/LPS O-acetylase OafA/YrhL
MCATIGLIVSLASGRLPQFDLLQSPLLFAAILTTAILTALALGKFGKHPSKVSNVNLTLEGLRGILALCVFAHHSFYFYHLSHQGKWQDPDSRFWMQLGQPAVQLFFMLTGYLFWRKVLEDGGNLNWSNYAIRRVFRLMPLYLFSVAVVVVSALGLGAVLEIRVRVLARA